MSKAWQAFIEGLEPGEVIKEVVLASWKRCREKHLNYEKVEKNYVLTCEKLRERCQEKEMLVKVGKPVLSLLGSFLKGQQTVILLCDEEGYILESIGNPLFISKAQKVHLSPGANWSENIKGTNAIGTALVEKTPITVLGWEHYVRENHFLNCWASPIRNTTGKIIGVLDISGEAATRNNFNFMEMVITGARLIEQNLRIEELEKKLNFCRRGIKLVSEMLLEGFMAVDQDGIITEINQAGASLIGRNRKELIGRHIAEVFGASRSWQINGRSLALQLENEEGKIITQLHQVTDESGNITGAVGVLKLKREKLAAEPLWVGRSELTQKVFKQAAKAAQTTSTVLIQGESGTGKEIVARYIHKMSPRCKENFIALNCAAIPPTLIESELFGYAEGAFTGAKRGGQPGKFELANGGTLFLDEIGDMPLNVQSLLLRVLQEREVYRIGDSRLRKIDVRIIAATNRDLAKLVAEGAFRLDLYYRLNVISIQVPPLRERIEDIWDLVPYILKKCALAQGKQPPAVSEEVYRHLLAHSWPGNIRELENCIESMVAMAEKPVLTVEDLPEELKKASCPLALEETPLLDMKTRSAIMDALKKCNGKIAPAARLLGVSRTTLYRKIKDLGINIRHLAAPF